MKNENWNMRLKLRNFQNFILENVFYDRFLRNQRFHIFIKINALSERTTPNGVESSDITSPEFDS